MFLPEVRLPSGRVLPAIGTSPPPEPTLTGNESPTLEIYPEDDLDYEFEQLEQSAPLISEEEIRDALNGIFIDPPTQDRAPAGPQISQQTVSGTGSTSEPTKATPALPKPAGLLEGTNRVSDPKEPIVPEKSVPIALTVEVTTDPWGTFKIPIVKKRRIVYDLEQPETSTLEQEQGRKKASLVKPVKGILKRPKTSPEESIKTQSEEPPSGQQATTASQDGSLFIRPKQKAQPSVSFKNDVPAQLPVKARLGKIPWKNFTVTVNKTEVTVSPAPQVQSASTPQSIVWSPAPGRLLTRKNCSNLRTKVRKYRSKLQKERKRAERIQANQAHSVRSQRPKQTSIGIQVDTPQALPRPTLAPFVPLSPAGTPINIGIDPWQPSNRVGAPNATPPPTLQARTYKEHKALHAKDTSKRKRPNPKAQREQHDNTNTVRVQTRPKNPREYTKKCSQ